MARVPEDFTEAEYRELVRLAASRYRFARFHEQHEPPCALWRHDLDFSVQRALALARIEAEESARATYFLDLHSEFYNALERANVDAMHEILELGHDLGLHFDPAFGDVDDQLTADRELLERTFGVQVRAFSVHNPELVAWADERDTIAGMVNAYGSALRESFSYVSDSNGIWRHRRLREVLEAEAEQNLHVLTHPAWWVPEPLAPRARIQRCIDGRARATALAYDDVLERSGRPNVA
ncbi:MAG: hypothetical protein QOI67_1973 [Gaiellaceae bacterium]|nr:hypothetical protein [Gaiellaceae bacterium]